MLLRNAAPKVYKHRFFDVFVNIAIAYYSDGGKGAFKAALFKGDDKDEDSEEEDLPINNAASSSYKNTK